MLGKKIADGCGRAELRDAVGAQLYATKADCGDVLYCLAIIAAPGDGRIAEMNFGRRWRYGRVEMRQVHGRIERLACEKGLARKCGGCGQGAHCAEEFAPRHTMGHAFSFVHSTFHPKHAPQIRRNRPGVCGAIPRRFERSTRDPEIAVASANRV